MTITPELDLDAVEVDRDVADLLPRAFTRDHQIVPIARQGNKLLVAIAHADDGSIAQRIKAACGCTVQLVRVRDDALQRRLTAPIESRPDHVLTAVIGTQPAADGDNAPPTSPSTLEADGPVALWVERLLRMAIAEGASDIHLEPQGDGLRVRLRQDGFLQAIDSPSPDLAAGICSRIKIMAQMDISERRKPQDGRFSLPTGHGPAVDLRISSCPTLFGEKLVIRLLDPAQVTHTIDELGYEAEQLDTVLAALRRPHGLILVTGPTGSGKTVSLYAALRLLNETHRNISSVEDPVEIQLDGINQVNLNLKAGLDFPVALRALLRQDPDVLMIGEIRDHETASIAIKAAQTGHLVLSTLHTNSAPESISRLANMGIPAYSLASSLNLVIAQRLLRRLCNACKLPDRLGRPYPVAVQDQPDTTERFPPRAWRACGCSRCVNGYRGRTGIYQVMPVTPTVQSLILDGSSTNRLRAHCRHTGIIDLHGAGLLKVARGLTSLDEVLRVAGDRDHA